MPEIILADHHDQVFSVWRKRNVRGLKVAHVDFHCDMRGLMIDRPAGQAFFTSHRETTFVDRGNFLAHAIMNGMVRELKWIHAEKSGRAYDAGPVVNYESDLKSPLYRIRHALSGRSKVDLNYSECLLRDWGGLEKGEQLDLDWDCFASVEFAKDKRELLVAEFLERDFNVVPETTFLIYSPGYSDPDRSLYEKFAVSLSKKFKADIHRLPYQELNTDGERYSGIRNLARNWVPAPVFAAKRKLSLAVRKVDAASDVRFFAAKQG